MHIFGETKHISPNAKAEISAKMAKLGTQLKKIGLHWPKTHLEEVQWPPKDASKRLLVKKKTIMVLFDTGSSGDLLFLENESNKCIPVVNRAVPESQSTSNGTLKR